MALNTITVSFNGQNETITKKRYQYDKGQVCVFDDIELPEAYKVIFSNNLTGENSIPMIGDENGVKVPDNFFLTGLTIYGWVYLSEGEDDGQTVKHFTIPVEKRVKETDEEPTPEEQTEIEQLIVALNGAVNTAETAAENAGNSARQAKTAAEHYPIIEDGYWYVWDVESEDYVSTGIKALGDDGTSPTVTVTAITGGHKVTITDVDGDHVFDVMDGTDGNGIQSIAKTSTVGNVDTYTITYTNGQTTTFTVRNGITPTVDDELSDESENPVQNKKVKEALDNLDAGDIAYDDTETYPNGSVGDGLSSVKAEINQLSESIAPVESTTTATAAHAVGELFMVGETLMVALSAIAIGDTITTEGGSPNAAVTTLSGEMIKDVQVNGTSVVSQGVANVPLAGPNQVGVGRVDNGYGLAINPNNNGLMYTYRAQDADVKAGTQAYRPIVPTSQHASTFYGLAKAAGSDEKNSSLAVGTYTDAAKVAIQKMLGIYEAPWELIREDTVTNAAEANIEITVDGNGQPFELTDAIILFETPQQATDSAKATHAILIYYEGASNPLVPEVNAWSQAANAAAHGCRVIVTQDKGIVLVESVANTTTANNANVRYRYNSGFDDRYNGIIAVNSTIIINKITIPAVLGTGHYKIYGKRKWS